MLFDAGVYTSWPDKETNPEDWLENLERVVFTNMPDSLWRRTTLLLLSSTLLAVLRLLSLSIRRFWVNVSSSSSRPRAALLNSELNRSLMFSSARPSCAAWPTSWTDARTCSGATPG